MAYSAFELSEQDGRPIELFEFTIGSQVYRYTSYDVNVMFMSQEFRAYALKRDAISLNPTQGVKIETDANFIIAQKLHGIPDAMPIRLKIYRIHEGDTDVESLLTWRGDLDGCVLNNLRATLSFDSVAKSRKKMAFRYTYSAGCENILYDPETCGVLKEAYKTVASVDTIVGLTITANEIDTLADGWFKGGEVRRIANNDSRMIVEHIGDTITLIAPFQDLEVGETIYVFAGCSHDFTACTTKFNTDENPDGQNYSGFPTVPTKNPFATDIRY